MVLVSALKEELEKQFFIARQISLFCGVTRYPPVKPQAHRNISIFILFYKEELNLNFCARQGGGRRECFLRTSSKMCLSQHIHVSCPCAVSWSSVGKETWQSAAREIRARQRICFLVSTL